MAVDQETVNAIREQVNSAIDSRLVGWRKQAKAFAAGFLCLIVLLLGDHFLLGNRVITFLREQAVGFDAELDRHLGRTVAFSYTNEYWIQPPTFETESLVFYARPRQQVRALVQVLHRGTGARLTVSISLDQRPPLRTTEDDIQWETIDLTSKVWDPNEFASAVPDVHYLVFKVDNHVPDTSDRVFVRVLVNVIGLEAREP